MFNATDTTSRRQQHMTRGTKTINAIYVSQGLVDCKSMVWLPFGNVIGNHPIAFLDIDITKLICRDKFDVVKTGQAIADKKREIRGSIREQVRTVFFVT